MKLSEMTLLPGMTFRAAESSAGYDRIEYRGHEIVEDEQGYCLFVEGYDRLIEVSSLLEAKEVIDRKS